jgi:hypothetical protein
VLARAAVEDEVDAVAETRDDVLGPGRAQTAEGVCARRRERLADGRQ